MLWKYIWIIALVLSSVLLSISEMVTSKNAKRNLRLSSSIASLIMVFALLKLSNFATKDILVRFGIIALAALGLIVIIVVIIAVIQELR